MLYILVLCAELCLLFSDFACGLSTGNVVSNPSFESLSGWEVHEQLSEASWAKPEHVAIEQAPAAHSGTNSLRLGPITDTHKCWAVFATQYIPSANLSKLATRPLVRMVYWTRGGSDDAARGVKLIVDVLYQDSTRLTAVLPAAKMIDTTNVTADDENNGFVRSCSIIPAYGEIRALGVHITLEGENTNPVYVDDVAIDVVEDIDDENDEDACSLFTETYPKRRQVSANFLTPTVPFANESITLCTQITLDELVNLVEIANIWDGPISAALVIPHDSKQSSQRQIQELTEAYYASKPLSRCMAVHLVFDDDMNEQDAAVYPLNYLRNVALKFAGTSHVFSMDANMSPGFSEREAWRSVMKAQVDFGSERNKQCLHCGFLVPLFDFKNDIDKPVIPASKEELLIALDQEKDTFRDFNVLQSMVDYEKWCVEDKPYEVLYSANQTAYFIVAREAPLMNTLVEDDVYVEDLHSLRYTFIVLSKAFLVTTREARTARNTKKQSTRDVLLMKLWKRDELEGVFSTTRENFLPGQRVVNVVSDPTHCSSAENLTQMTGEKDEEEEADGGISCRVRTVSNALLKQGAHPKTFMVQMEKGKLRVDVIVEHMMRDFRISSFVQFPVAVSGSITMYLPMMHADTVLSLIPSSADEKYTIDGLFQLYESPKNVSSMLAEVRKRHQGPFIFFVKTNDIKDLPVTKLHEYIYAALSAATDRDVILFEGQHPSVMDVHHDMCKLHPDWKFYHLAESDGYVMKFSGLKKNLPPNPLFPPPLTLSTVEPHCDQAQTKVDVILMTRNRPLQTYAFLDSLREYVRNINKVWVLYRADEELFESGYDLALSCAGRSIPVEGVRDKAGEFGSKLLDITQKSEAQYLVFVVDEMIWLRKVDLQYSACLLKKGNGAFHTFQLRLGKNLGFFPSNERLFPMAHNSHVFAYYPHQLEGDFGYLLNVDGVMVSKSDFLEDNRDILPRHNHPGNLENSWVHRKTHIRSKQWHLMYDYSTVVNNAGLKDGRMASHWDSLKQAAYDFAKKFVEDREKIDVQSFAALHREPRAAHIYQPVAFKKLHC